MFIVVGGPAGCGKSTVGMDLAKELGSPFLEGDDLHPQANIEKMSNGIPLTDDDRWGWLKTVAQQAEQSAEKSENSICVATCSSLKKVYRDYIRSESPKQQVVFIFIAVGKDELMRRVTSRENHFMKSDMIQSQLDIMEVPKSDEPNCLVYGNSVDIKDCVFKIIKLQKQ